jgi:uncharacterized protein YidB (DUF937 family)
MANGTPSMLALLGLLAVAGYQNRDKIGQVLNNLGNSANAPGGGQGGLGGMLSGLGGMLEGNSTAAGSAPAAGSGGLGGLLSGLGGAGGGNVVSGGLGDLMKTFTDAGHGTTANSWVDPSVPTQGLSPQQVEQAIGDANLNELTQRTGLSRDELLKRLATAIPQTVDHLTPNGTIPSETEARSLLSA